ASFLDRISSSVAPVLALMSSYGSSPGAGPVALAVPSLAQGKATGTALVSATAGAGAGAERVGRGAEGAGRLTSCTGSSFRFRSNGIGAGGAILPLLEQPLQHLAAASSADTSLVANLKHITVILATWDAVWEVYKDPEWARQRLRLYRAQDRALEQLFNKVRVCVWEEGQLFVFFGAASIDAGGGWGVNALLRACCKVVCRPRGSDQLRVRVVLVDEHRITRVSSAVNGQQPCEEELHHEQPTRPAAKRSKGEQAAETTQPTKGKGKAQAKAAKAKPAPQPGRWLDRGCNAALNMQRIGESRWRPLELCYWPEQGKLPAKGKEYPGLGYKRLRDKPPKAQQQQQQPAMEALVRDKGADTPRAPIVTDTSSKDITTGSYAAQSSQLAVPSGPMAPVYLNVYDLTQHNQLTYFCGVGIFHAGVEVYNTEYAYGGHEFDYTGVFATNPRDAPGLVVFRESIYMGETDLSQEEVQQLIYKMGQEFKGNRYHLLQRNCNHFASNVVYQLTGRPAPSWINRLASIAVMLHCLLPPSWVPPLQTPSISDSKRGLLSAGPRSDAYEVDRVQPHSSTIVQPPRPTLH
ncbi:hypothetical protein QJQ45_016430, partial [Haematococcus lacustris]